MDLHTHLTEATAAPEWGEMEQAHLTKLAAEVDLVKARTAALNVAIIVMLAAALSMLVVAFAVAARLL